MTNYTVHPESFSSIELRDGESIDTYIAKARGFRSTDEFREYRDGSPEKREAMRRTRNRDNTSADDGNDIRRLTLDLLKAQS